MRLIARRDERRPAAAPRPRAPARAEPGLQLIDQLVTLE